MNRFLKILRLPVAVFLLYMLTGCYTTRHSPKVQLILNNDYCIADTNLLNDHFQPYSLQADSLIAADIQLKKIFSEKEILVANAAGIIPLAIQWQAEIHDSGSRTNTTLLFINAQIQQRINRIRGEIEGIAAELDCEAERTNRAAGYLENLAQKRNNRLTIGAIFAGTVTTAAPLVIKEQGPQNAIVITSGAITTLLGIAALFPDKKKVSFTYRRNLLSDIWYGPVQSSTYPPAIWYMLTQKQFNAANPNLSMQQNLKKRWLHIEVSPGPGPRQESLLFRQGGVFTESDLTTRVTLLKQLEATIRLLNIQVDILEKAVDKMILDNDGIFDHK